MNQVTDIPSMPPTQTPEIPVSGHIHNHLSEVSAKTCEDLRRSRSIEGLDPDECVVTIIRKHPIGLIPFYFGAVFGVGLAFGLLYFLIGQLFASSSSTAVFTWLGIAFAVSSLLATIALIIGTYVYRQSALIITNKNVTQIIQRSLFSRKVSELSISNVEDVTADKHGIIAALFNYGQLKVQTAGEMENFLFSYCPNPNRYGRIILDAHQEYVDKLKNDD